ncbi:MAG: hypothetical protein IJU28_10920, partial [Clostridia bacterium]|nr:hypothetical protein [Clostridia bacterium]
DLEGGQPPPSHNPQGQLCRPEERFLRRARRRPEQIIASLQFLHPKILAGILAKTVILLHNYSMHGVLIK